MTPEWTTISDDSVRCIWRCINDNCDKRSLEIETDPDQGVSSC